MTSTTQIVGRYAIAAQEDRSAPRIPVSIPASLRAPGSHGFPVTVTDLSLGGFACEALTGMRPGTLCWLTLPGLHGQQAEIIWNNGTTVGCAFADLLAPAVLDMIVIRHSRTVVRG